MDRNAVMDFFGVVRIVGLSLLVCGLVIVTLGLLVGVLGMFKLAAVIAILLAWTVFPGAILLVLASIARPMVARMRFTSDQHDRAKQP